MSVALPIPLPAPPAEADEARFLRDQFRHHSRTFSLATRLLPADVRLPVATLYLYCRTVDEVADHRVLEVGPATAREEVEAMRLALDNALAGRPDEGFLWRRLAAVHATFGLPAAPLHQLLDGAAWDLDGRAIGTMDDLRTYADLVAGSVGAVMLPFLAERADDRAALEPPARALGRAMQLTNIVRDVGEDWRRLGRVYLPADARARHGVTDAVLDAARPTPGLRALLEEVMAEAEALYDYAEGGIARLPQRVRLGVRAAARMYREIHNEVRAAGYDSLRRRAFVPLGRKLRLVVHDDYRRRKQRLGAAP